METIHIVHRVITELHCVNSKQVDAILKRATQLTTIPATIKLGALIWLVTI